MATYCVLICVVVLCGLVPLGQQASCPVACGGTCKNNQQGDIVSAVCGDVRLQTLPQTLVNLSVHDASPFTLPLGRLSGYLLNQPHLLTLDINNYGVKKLESGCFTGCPLLRTLNLAHNHVDGIQADNLIGLDNLEILNLDFNTITDVGDFCFRNLSKLRELRISHNLLEVINGRMLEGLGSLSILDLRNNRIKTVHGQSFSRLHQVEEIDLQNNHINQLADGLFIQTRRLRRLNISNNEIEILAPSIFLGELDTVDLSNNSIRFIEEETFNGCFMRSFSIQNNLLETLSERFQVSFNASSHVYLSGNPWTCDCDVRWLPAFLNICRSEPECAGNGTNTTLPVSVFLHERELTCNPEDNRSNGDNNARLVGAITGGILSLLLVSIITTFVLYRYYALKRKVATSSEETKKENVTTQDVIAV